ncbi:GNAT family N-acetyltransferase [Paenibacillus pini]|uniref:N-acetyltransferase domain-containing protein n=1 Tax=Paenibacillus pini JCM 16418 TaxID=1236976 RepID=W7YWG5_9BACL|nr:GNAT family N-acetyltransferase [Paenibacillus pini]GAF06669.1 hypothetical protein JCM16418_641 [Paenibacillus pini JCM 16418]
MHRHLEEYTLNTWPAEHTKLLNGWLLRYASGYTKRSNSVSSLYWSTDGNVLDAIRSVEKCYMEYGQDVIFKITPFINPSGLDEVLNSEGYTSIDHSSVRQVDLDEVVEPNGSTHALIKEECDEQWLDQLAMMNGLSQKQKDTTRRLLKGSPLKQAFVTLFQNDIPVAVGLGVIDCDYIGLYDIVTNAQFRRRGYGEQLVLHILKWGKANAAKYSFLQVVQANLAAIRLYDKLGYKELYEYSYRRKRLE